MTLKIPPAQTPIAGKETVSRSWYDYLLWVADQINGIQTGSGSTGSTNFTQSNVVLGRVSAGSGPGEEIAFTDQMQALADDTSFALMRTTLGIDAENVPYTPSNLANWGGVDPGETNDALDYLAGNAASFTPTYIPSGEITTVTENSQMLFVEDIVVDGTLIVDGVLIQIDSVQDAEDEVAAHEVTYDHASYDSHLANTANPHAVTKAQVGLGNADNTSDVDKPVSTAQAAANVTDRARANHTGTQTLATISDAGTIASQDANNVNIDGGAIDGTVIGGTTPAAGDFTTLDTSGNAVIGDGGAATKVAQVNSAAGSLARFEIASAGVPRWRLSKSSLAESGSDAGSRFEIHAVNDGNTAQDLVLRMERAAGGEVDLFRPLGLNGNNLKGVLLAADNGSELDHGTWTATLTAGANASAVSGGSGMWNRVGDTVHWSLRFSVTPTAAATNTTVFASLPLASNFTVNTDLLGTGGLNFNFTESWGVVADAVNDRMQIQSYVARTTALNIQITGSYQVL